MSSRALQCAAVATALSLLAAAPAVAAKTITVSGKVRDAKGYTVSASATTGTGRSAKLGRTGRFTLKVRGTSASVSLIRPGGRYYGPVVLTRVAHGRVRLTVKRSVNLGTISLAGGYAVLRTPLEAKELGTAWAKADKHGKPVGAGRMGLRAKSAKIRARVAQAGPPPTVDLGADGDRDGLINAYDIDDDNDGVLDPSDNDSGNPNNLPGRVFTNLRAELPDTLNADLGPVSESAIDAMLAKDLPAAFDASPWEVLAGRTLSAVNVNCFSIAWCAPGTGSAVIADGAYGPQGPGPGQPATGTRFVAFDPDGDGLPNLSPDARHIQQPAFGSVVKPGMGRAGLDPSATVDFHYTTNQGPFEYATTLGPSFVTVPAITSVNGQAITYPVAPNGPGTGNGNDLALSSTTVTFTFFRPQRPAIPGAETPGYYDMGHLRYEVSNPLDGSGAACPATAFSNLSPGLSLTANGPDQGVTDSANDQPANAANVLSFTLDLAACTGQSLAGRELPLGITARTARGENAATKLWVRFAG